MAEFENLQKAYQEQRTKLSTVTQDATKSGVLKETVKKQEQVISKLEGLLDKLMKERKVKDAADQDNKWKHKLESQAENQAFSKAQEEQYKIKIKRQENDIQELGRQLQSA